MPRMLGPDGTPRYQGLVDDDGVDHIPMSSTRGIYRERG